MADQRLVQKFSTLINREFEIAKCMDRTPGKQTNVVQ